MRNEKKQRHTKQWRTLNSEAKGYKYLTTLLAHHPKEQTTEFQQRSETHSALCLLPQHGCHLVSHHWSPTDPAATSIILLPHQVAARRQGLP